MAEVKKSATDSLRVLDSNKLDTGSVPLIVGIQNVPDDSTQVQIRIYHTEIVGRTVADTLEVTLQAGTRVIAGFDLKIALTSPFVRIVSIIRGELLDSCKWEYFSARELPLNTLQGRPRSIWQAVALAQMISDTAMPKCYTLGRESSILKIVISNSHVLQMPETTAAIFFWWEDCTDNVLSGSSGSELYMSTNVLDYYPVELDEVDGVFPNHQGALRQCVSPRSRNKPKRLASFHNGGVSWKSAVDLIDTSSAQVK